MPLSRSAAFLRDSVSFMAGAKPRFHRLGGMPCGQMDFEPKGHLVARDWRRPIVCRGIEVQGPYALAFLLELHRPGMDLPLGIARGPVRQRKNSCSQFKFDFF